ncbi:MAG: hypothetical protein M1818_006802 [Claussenomyces sp. TS43310]|nr:MAG: hypothetical protein M1818_006802 [Claussenomyces sp. TS43310]
MSFGGSPSDIIIVVTFCRRLYKQCKTAGGEYLEISREVRGLHTVLRHLKYEVKAPESVLNRDSSRYANELGPVIGDCHFTLRKLDDLLMKYGRLTEDTGGAARLWDRVRFGSTELDELGDIRMKLINHKTSITVFLDTVQLHESGKQTELLEIQTEQLEVILDKVDGIAARMGQRAPSMLTTYGDDDKEVWKQFRRELVAEGFSSNVLQQHKDILRAYIRQIDQNGLLDDAMTSPTVDTERWLDDMPQQSPSEVPPTYSSLNTNEEDACAKVLVPEDNMKFPQSLKAELANSQRTAMGDASKQMLPHHASNLSAPAEGIGLPVSTPLLATSPSMKKPLDNGGLRVPSRSQPIWTAPQVAGGLDIPKVEGRPHPHSLDERGQSLSGSPLSYRSATSFDESARSVPHRQRPTVPESASYDKPVPMPPSALELPTPNPIGRRSPRLAADQYGQEIPPDAKWTQVRRSLISPEVLAQDGRRYEARSDFVAILGVLSRKDIEAYVARTAALREARARQMRRSQRRRDSSSSSSSTSSEDGHLRPPMRERRSYPGRGLRPPRAHAPNPHGTWPVPHADETVPRHCQVQQSATPTATWPMPQQHEGPLTPASPQYSFGPGEDRKARPRNHKWRNGLTAAGLGGAAASLLHVLSDAAEAL